MKYPYYSPNFRIKDLIRALFKDEEKASDELKEYYRKMTGKKYTLLTNSCRTALFLTYKVIQKKGEVITSPLTCKVAIDPIEESDNRPVFADINKNSLNIEVSDIEHRITKKTIAIQAIHLGGLSCEMDKIKEIANEYNLITVEDCAQSLGAKYQGQNTGSFGDVSCFSLIKNAYGIGGGVLATNDEAFYLKAKEFNSTFYKQSIILLIYRTIRNIIDTKQQYKFGRILFKMLKRVKGEKKSYTSVKGQLKRVSPLELKIAAFQLTRLTKLHKKRSNIGTWYTKKLNDLGLIYNKGYLEGDSSFTKYFLYNPLIDFSIIKDRLISEGIEIKHLEQNLMSTIQDRLVSKEKSQKLNLHNYSLVHDSLISLPITENMIKEDVFKIVKSLNNEL